MIDAAEGLTDQDKKIAGVAHEAGKGIVIVVNKWDLIEKETNTMRDFRRLLEADMQFMSYAPSVFISVNDKQRVNQVIEMAEYVSEKRALQSAYGTAEQPYSGCSHDETAAFGQGTPAQDILCNAGGRKTAAVQFPNQQAGSDALLICKIS